MVAGKNGLSPAEAERLRAFERQRHDEMAASYHDFFTPVTSLAIAPLLEAVRLAPGASVLDVATGPGTLAAAAHRRGARPVGIDISPGMVELARSLHPDLDFRVAEVERLPFPDAAFDAVLCSFALGHLPLPEAALAECIRTLKPGGRIAFSWWDDPSRQRIQGLFREAIGEIGVAPPPVVPAGHFILRFSDSAALRRLLEDAGLADIVVADHATTHLVPDLETLWRGGLGSFALTASAIVSQDERTQQAIRAALERRAETYRTAEGLRLPIAFKIATGRKRG